MTEGFWLMLIGMSTVFAFLTLMVATMHVSSWAIKTYLPEDEDPNSTDNREQLVRVAIAMAAVEAHGAGR